MRVARDAAPMTRRRGFWAVFIVLAAASVVAALRLFPAAFPIVNLDLAMDRETAIAEAEATALRYGWDPPMPARRRRSARRTRRSSRTLSWRPADGTPS